MERERHSVKFTASDKELERAFVWAKERALSYVHDDVRGGPCYEAALPGRRSYCMRDFSHQAPGAHFLGLSAHNRNMAEKFVGNISREKDYCSYWEITFDGEPCPADYRDDARFWYNLPANFDVMCACERLYDLTGDVSYLTGERTSVFHRMSLKEYVRRWDRDGDGIPDRLPADGHRGIASYNECGTNGYVTAADTLAVEAAAYRTGARMYRLSGEWRAAAEAEATAHRLAGYFRSHWWNRAEEHYDTLLLPDGTTGGSFNGTQALFPLRFGLITDRLRRARQSDYAVAYAGAVNTEELSYFPVTLWQEGRGETARELFLHLTGESNRRRDYPEVSFAAVEALIAGYLGVSADAERRELTLRPRVKPGEWAAVTDVPLWGGVMDLTVRGGEYLRVTVRGTGCFGVGIGNGTYRAVQEGGELVLPL